jgi:hypothetical protein
MGSGKLIKLAIVKYGLENFNKIILNVFDSEDKAAILEKMIVNDYFVSLPNTYNMKVGGYGGFDHISKLDPIDRPNLIALRGKKNDRLAKYVKSRTNEELSEMARKGYETKKIRGTTKPNIPKEKRVEINSKIAESVSGENNAKFGTHLYISKVAEKLPNSTEFGHHRFRVGQQPDGWVTFAEWRDVRKDKTKGSYGRKWFNDGTNNYFLKPSDPKSIDLVIGRLLWRLDR